MQLMQFRYYGEKDSRNYPSNLNKGDLCTGNAFNNYYPLSKIIVHGTSGIELQINDEATTIKLGDIEYYELEDDDITSVCFNNSTAYTTTSLDQIFNADAKATREPYLFIDIYY